MAISKQLSSILPLHSFFFTLFDLKLGSEIITWFAILNKVAGFYGLLAIFSGGTLAQLSMYLYSVASIALFAWGAKQIGDVRLPLRLYLSVLKLISSYALNCKSQSMNHNKNNTNGNNAVTLHRKTQQKYSHTPISI